MAIDLDWAREFLAKWDAIQPDGTRANRTEIAQAYRLERSHAYYTAARCRRALAKAQMQKDPIPTS